MDSVNSARKCVYLATLRLPIPRRFYLGNVNCGIFEELYFIPVPVQFGPIPDFSGFVNLEYKNRKWNSLKMIWH